MHLGSSSGPEGHVVFCCCQTHEAGPLHLSRSGPPKEQALTLQLCINCSNQSNQREGAIHQSASSLPEIQKEEGVYPQFLAHFRFSHTSPKMADRRRRRRRASQDSEDESGSGSGSGSDSGRSGSPSTKSRVREPVVVEPVVERPRPGPKSDEESECVSG